ncbi:putative flavoprotein involved in K+ transport [Nonomuraea muscovyensis]|uniref:Putative flavoprotein involved in K+ transport n=1 Tax=Nonomuraea muscovyensis TaxID=1124761 RepID=A0A7X0EZK9_9ACTN|nr:NAD(P)-binding domain-containing protein [Nonomuraea muscovyensis]MBB6349923.1 putative flavoprotein involved in K+ transport [Nonomuraea muscovyensis]
MSSSEAFETLDVVVIGGGQSGLAAARALLEAGLRPVVLEAGDQAIGSWPAYYDSLTLFSPARHSTLPGLPFPGDPDHHPHRDEVVTYLTRFADQVQAGGGEIRTRTRVEAVEPDGRGGFVVRTADGSQLHARGVVAASGSFGNPHVPALPGQDAFTGRLLHVADYREPKSYTGRRVVVVGGGNSAVQVGHELAEVATVTLATHAPIAFAPQVIGGHDIHHWLTTTGFDQLPPAWLAPLLSAPLVLDEGHYQAAFEAGRWDRKPMFTGFDGDRVIWADGTPERVDTVLFATGYRPNLGYLRPLGALDDTGAPLHAGGISTTCPGLVYVGLEFQRSFASNTLRGVIHDAEYVTAPLAAHVRGSAAAVFGGA